jgi:hypothetical protein
MCSGHADNETSANMTLGTLGGGAATVIVDTTHPTFSRLGSKDARIGRACEANVPYTSFYAAQMAFPCPTYSIGGLIGEGTNSIGG